MPNIKPISDLRNYSDVLRDVSVGAPVFLTKNGRGRYAIIDMRDYEKTRVPLICRRMTTKVDQGVPAPPAPDRRHRLITVLQKSLKDIKYGTI